MSEQSVECIIKLMTSQKVWFAKNVIICYTSIMIKERSKIKIVVIICICAAILLAAVAGFFILRRISNVNDAPQSMLPDHQEAESEEIEFDPWPDLPKNELDNNLFYNENGLLKYPGAECGIDVSSWQGEIDWFAVADSGIDFAVIQFGYRGYSEGGLNIDEYFIYNIEGAQTAGIKTGVYFFSQAISIQEAIEEADFVINTLDGYNIDLPVYYDWEYIESEARTDNITGDEMTSFARAFCDRIAEAGYTPGLYFGLRQGYSSYDLSQLDDLTFWLAEYNSEPTFIYSFDMWQYSASGIVNGIEGTVDVNIRW